MTSTDASGAAADVAAVRSAIEREIAGSTLLTVYAEAAAATPDVIAHQWQAGGSRQTLTYQQVREPVGDTALGLAAVGLQPGEFAAVWSCNRSEATIADYAVMHARGVPVFIYPTVSPEQAADLIGHCEATVVLIEREFLPVLASIQARLPRLRAVVMFGDEPVPGTAAGGEPAEAAGARALAWADVLAQGRAAAERDPGAFERSCRQVHPGQPGDADLHLGHDRPPQGRHDHAPQHPLLPAGAAAGRPGRAADGRRRRRHAGVLPADGAHHRALLRPLGRDGPPGHRGLPPRSAQAVRGRGPGPPDGPGRHPPGVGEAARRAARRAARCRPGRGPRAARRVKEAVRIRIGLDRCRLAASGAAPVDPEIVAFFRRSASR